MESKLENLQMILLNLRRNGDRKNTLNWYFGYFVLEKLQIYKEIPICGIQK